MSQPNPLCVGIDVSKTTLDIATANNEFAQFTAGNDTDGFELIIAELRKHLLWISNTGHRNSLLM